MGSSNPSSYWLKRARRLALLVNGVWLLERLAPVVIIINLTVCCLVLALQGRIIQIEPVLYIAGAIVLVAAVVLTLIRYRRPYGIYDALLRLETAFCLDSRLTTAYDGHVAWPDRRACKVDDGWLYQIDFRRPTIAVLGSFAMLFGSFLIPFSSELNNPLAEKPSPPLEISKVEVWIEQLEEADFIDETAMQELKESVADLKNRPSDEWFTAGALEAADHLYESTENSIDALAQNMQVVSSVLSGAPSLPENLNDEVFEQIEEAYQEALSNMQGGLLQLSPELLNQLGQMDLKQLGRIDPSALKELQDRSEQWAQACQQLGGMTEGEKERLASYCEGLMAGEGRNQRFAPGSIQRGRGDAEMSYSRYRSPDGVATEEAVSNEDLRNAAIGENIRTTISNQQEKPAEFAGPAKAGSLGSLGSGGEAVWVDRLTPAERKLLREHFK